MSFIENSLPGKLENFGSRIQIIISNNCIYEKRNSGKKNYSSPDGSKTY
jgi:hypothetical protein